MKPEKRENRLNRILHRIRRMQPETGPQRTNRLLPAVVFPMEAALMVRSRILRWPSQPMPMGHPNRMLLNLSPVKPLIPKRQPCRILPLTRPGRNRLIPSAA